MPQLAPSKTTRRIDARAIALCLVAIPLAQSGSYYVGYADIRASWPWPWLVGTPLAYLLIGGLTAFLAAGGLTAAAARGQGSRLGAIGGICGAVVSTLVAAGFILWQLNVPQPAPSHLGPFGPAFRTLLVLSLIVPAFLVVSLLGVASAMLGGLLGAALRAAIQRGETTLTDSAGEEATPRDVMVIGAIVVALGILAGVAVLLLIGGSFASIR